MPSSSCLVAAAALFFASACTGATVPSISAAAGQNGRQARVCGDAFEPFERGYVNGVGSYLSLEAVNAAQPHFRFQGYDATFLRHGSTPSADYRRGELVSVEPLALLAAGMTLVLNPCRLSSQRSRLPVEALGWDGGRSTPTIDVDVGMVRVEFPSSMLRFASAAPGERAAYNLTLDEGSWRFTLAAGIVRRERRIDGQPVRRALPYAEPMRVQYTGLTLTPDLGVLKLSLDTREGALHHALHRSAQPGAVALVAERGRFGYRSARSGVTKVVAGDFGQLVVNGYELVTVLRIDEQADDWTPDALVRALKADGFVVLNTRQSDLRLWTVTVRFDGTRV
jgi:hypothetical protein